MEASRRARLAFLARPIAFALGLVLAIYLVHDAGIDRVLAIVAASRGWVPMLVALEMIIVILDGLAARALVGPSSTPLSSWIRSTIFANASAVFLPAGRAAGEAVRATTLSTSIGAPRAALASARLQGIVLLANGAASTLLAIVIGVFVPSSVGLATLLAGNAIVCAALGASVFLLVRSARLAAWLRRFVPSATTSAPSSQPPARGAALALSFAGRLVQTFQYGVAVAAVGGVLDATNAVTAQGIHLVGASVGDLVPAQLGAMEAAYRWLGNPLGGPPASAVSIAVLMRGVQVALALAGIGLASLLPARALS